MRRNKIMSILLSLIMAVCLWIYVVSTVTPEDSQWIYNIPVTFVNEDGLFSDRNLTLTEGRDTTVNLRLSGKRQDLLKLNNSNLVLTVDLSQVTAPGTWHLTYDLQYPETVSSNSISVVNRSRGTVDIEVDQLSVKEIPVQAVFQGNVASGYVLEPIKLEYDTLEISGPKDLVSTVDSAQVVLERNDVSKSVSAMLDYTLLDQDGNPVESSEIQCDVEKIGVEMPVYMLKEVPLTVTLIEGGGASADHAVTTIEPSTVSIKGDPEELEALNSISLGTIDLASIQKTATKNVEIIIPNGMENLTGDTATVTVELANLKTKTFQVTNIEFTNAPSDYRVTLGTTSLQVQIRGVEEEISELAASNIRAVVDLSSVGSSLGQYVVSADIYVDGFADVGAMGSYSVLVTISEPVTETAVEVSLEPESMSEMENTEESP